MAPTWAVPGLFRICETFFLKILHFLKRKNWSLFNFWIFCNRMVVENLNVPSYIFWYYETVNNSHFSSDIRFSQYVFFPILTNIFSNFIRTILRFTKEVAGVQKGISFTISPLYHSLHCIPLEKKNACGSLIFISFWLISHDILSIN